MYIEQMKTDIIDRESLCFLLIYFFLILILSFEREMNTLLSDASFRGKKERTLIITFTERSLLVPEYFV